MIDPVRYPIISSGFFKNKVLSQCFVGVVRKSISDISAATLSIIKIIIVPVIKIFPVILSIQNNVHNKIDSLIHRFGVSKLCEVYHKYILYIGKYLRMIFFLFPSIV